MKQVEPNLTGKINTAVTLAGYWKDSMPKKPGKLTDEGQRRDWDGLITLLQEFCSFASGYRNVLLQAPTSRQFVINSATERLSKNFDILSRAAEQRRGTVTKNSPAYYLAQVEDKLTSYCSQWLPNLKDTSAYVVLKMPVAYYEKTYGISRSLYSPEIPLISIPLDEYNDGKWLAIAHEMGHHLYWNSVRDLEAMTRLHDAMYKAVANALKLLDPETIEPWGYWLEEIFAEICGVLFAGPEYVISTQNVAAEKIYKPEDFLTNDNEHPAPFLRPWIVLEALCQLQKETPSDEAFLNKAELRWNSFCKDAGALKCKCGKTREATLENLRSEVGHVVNALLTAPVWPGGMRLVDLIQYNRQETEGWELDDLPTLPALDQTPLQPIMEANIPASIQEIWDFIKKNIPEKKEESATEKAGNLWNALIYLSMEDQHGHWPIGPHADLQFHWWAPWAGTHRHGNPLVG